MADVNALTHLPAYIPVGLRFTQLNKMFYTYRKIPSLLEYFSYNFCFSYFLAGPACTYKEYEDFITGSNFTSAKLQNPNQFAQVKNI